MAQTYQADVMLSLSYLLGERTIPSTGTEGRKDFIQRTLNEVYRNYPWKFNEGLATLTVASGIASLPSDFSLDHNAFINYSTGTTSVDLELADVGDQDSVNIGDNKYWITSTTGDGVYVLNTKEIVSNVVVRYQKAAPILGASVYTPFPSVMTLALGAKRYYRMSQDPEADISQDEAIFQNRLSEVVRAQQMSAPRIRRKSAQSISGYSTGDF